MGKFWGYYPLEVASGGVEKSGMLEQKSSNISETHRDRGKINMEGL